MRIIKDFGSNSSVMLDDSLILLGDAIEVQKRLPDQRIQSIVCSPPYWGLRDYGVPGQLGAESDVNEYVDKLVAIFKESKRVLKDNGLLWLNIGDSYTSGNRKYRAPDRKTDLARNVRAMSYRPDTPIGLKPKDLVGVPWRVAFALQQDGWYLRSDIIWYKPNCLPESVKDRPTKSHEYIFLLSKSKKYYYDNEAIKEPTNEGKLRNKRSVWSVHTEAFEGAHFATFPADLITPCIKSSTKPGDFVLDPFFGAGTVGIVCNQLGRRFVGIDVSPFYIDMAAERINQTPVKLFNESGEVNNG